MPILLRDVYFFGDAVESNLRASPMFSNMCNSPNRLPWALHIPFTSSPTSLPIPPNSLVKQVIALFELVGKLASLVYSNKIWSTTLEFDYQDTKVHKINN